MKTMATTTIHASHEEKKAFNTTWESLDDLRLALEKVDMDTFVLNDNFYNKEDIVKTMDLLEGLIDDSVIIAQTFESIIK